MRIPNGGKQWKRLEPPPQSRRLFEPGCGRRILPPPRQAGCAGRPGMQNSLDPHYPMYICAFFLVLFLFLFSPPLFLASEDFKRGSDLEKRLGWQRRLNEAVLNSRMEGGRGKGEELVISPGGWFAWCRCNYSTVTVWNTHLFSGDPLQHSLTCWGRELSRSVSIVKRHRRLDSTRLKRQVPPNPNPTPPTPPVQE